MKCHPSDQEILPNGKTAGFVRLRDRERMMYIKSQVKDVHIVWECEINNLLKNDHEMREIFDSYLDDGPIEIRSAFFGGRTAPLRLYHKATADQKIEYVDINSLYPFIWLVFKITFQKCMFAFFELSSTTNYPVGIPTVHVLNQTVNWTQSAHNPYPLALLKVLIVPPRKIDVPVLPVKVDDRLLFPTCITCCRQYPRGAVMRDYSCAHSEEERSWVSTVTSLELNAALDAGYTVKKCYRVLEYKQSDNKLFRDYISDFMAQKIHASGFSDDIKGRPEAEQQFIQECLSRFDIKIEREKMKENKSKRQLAKLCLNNLCESF